MANSSRSARRRGMLMGAAIASSRSKKRQASDHQQPTNPQSDIVQENISSDGVVEQLKKFAELRDQGILTEDEFQAKKAQLLNL